MRAQPRSRMLNEAAVRNRAELLAALEALPADSIGNLIYTTLFPSG